MYPNHVLLSCKANWSHLRSLCILAARIAASRTLVITILVADVDEIVHRVTQELARSMREEEIADGTEVRVVGLFTDDTKNGGLDDSFRLAWKSLMSQKAIRCAHTSIEAAAASRPSLVILDGFQLSWLKIIRADVSPPPVFQWMMAFSGGLLYMCGPADLGGRGGQPALHDQHNCTDFVRIPGLPPMTCIELNPQDVGDKRSKIQMAEATMAEFLEEADGLLTTCASAYDDKESLESITKWIARRNKRMTFHIGPMLPLMPANRITMKILAHAHPDAKIPENMITEFQTLGHGLFLPFAPQQAVLAHEACGWFVTHGGANGAVEALSQGVPLIGWPFAVDQPLNVAYMARTLDVGFELTTPRTGSCPLARGSSSEPSPTLDQYKSELECVLDATQKKIGKRKRENAQRIGSNLALAWSRNGGRAREELQRFLDKLQI
ncbi:glycosyltransferase family 1 protein [Dothidotthia symphoricarpi CBS 119687]|uniref:Glycosyltransferase family 1 protein n=1 Tax=Dothidotthia symphoricarpi CBS 119687 TaxID=1392245 RepID=A0A6A6A8Y5_9PLEO|nr:glycosyltransferase family 1 protein [Dothidotthia symphoricarpi CBS 119687]KAF2128280.1 glycosyltransferase family 1 protein [Dothidotthia symphoricarpi CBS 119687]